MMQGGAPQVDWGHGDFPIHLFMLHNMYHNFRIFKRKLHIVGLTGKKLVEIFADFNGTELDGHGRASCNFSKTRQACALCDSLGSRGGKLNIQKLVSCPGDDH